MGSQGGRSLMTYTLGSASEPNATWGSYWNDMGVCVEESGPKKADLMPEPMIGADSNETDVYDAGGAIRELTVTFKKVDSFANIATFAQALMTLINGDQIPPHYPVSFNSDVYGTINVKIKMINPSMRMEADGTTVLVYTLHMIESSTIG